MQSSVIIDFILGALWSDGNRGKKRGCGAYTKNGILGACRPHKEERTVISTFCLVDVGKRGMDWGLGLTNTNF